MLVSWNDTPTRARDRRVRRTGHDGGRGGLCRPAGSDRRVRQRRHAVDREAHAHPARLHLASPGGDGLSRPDPARTPALEGRVQRADYGWFGKVMDQHYVGDDTELPALAGWVPGRLCRRQRRGFRGAVATASCAAARTRPLAWLPRMRLLAHGRAARLPRRQRVHQLHRLGWRTRLHAAHQPGDVRHPPGAGHRQQPQVRVDARRAGRHASPMRPRPTTSTMAREKPIRIWSRIGRRPLLAGGNSNGDIPMLQYTGGLGRAVPAAALLHDDAGARVRLHGRL